MFMWVQVWALAVLCASVLLEGAALEQVISTGAPPPYCLG